jgi:hypothetical protein
MGKEPDKRTGSDRRYFVTGLVGAEPGGRAVTAPGSEVNFLLSAITNQGLWLNDCLYTLN